MKSSSELQLLTSRGEAPKMKGMRIVSLVPSWTETLIECGLNVVGRTRFCLHPGEEVSKIPIVGGTKQADWEKIRSLKPDVVLLDREENPKEFAELSPCPWLATHVTSLDSLERELKILGQHLQSSPLTCLADELRSVRQDLPASTKARAQAGIIERWGDWESFQEPVVYVIWKNPWMAVRQEDTFIGSVLDELGYQVASLGEGKYPVISDEDLRRNVVLFSSEPYPFVKKRDEAKAACPRGALVDGECFSWFGLRAIRFLKSLS